jgi:hypothetical protein
MFKIRCDILREPGEDSEEKHVREGVASTETHLPGSVGTPADYHPSFFQAVSLESESDAPRSLC